MQQIINIEDLSLAFGKEHLFTKFNLQLAKGEKIAITGESGKGKSSLLHLIAGFIPSFKGKVNVGELELNPRNIHKIRKMLAWLPQDISLNIKAVEELLYAPFQFAQNKEKRPNKEQIQQLFEAFSLSEELLHKKLKEISGGQKQRIILASCLLLHKPILLLDEPSSALDKHIKEKVTDYILGIKDLSIIAVTHDEYWMQRSDRIIQLA